MEQSIKECMAMSTEDLEKLLDKLYDKQGYAEDDEDEDVYSDLAIDIVEVENILYKRYKKQLTLNLNHVILKIPNKTKRGNKLWETTVTIQS